MKRKLLIIFFAMLGYTLANAQNRKTVSGTVKDGSGAPLTGVSVTELKTTNGVSTDASGNFSINVASDATLQFTFIGFKSQSISATGKTTINVVLEDDALGLGEVVVTALGIKRETKALGYSVTEVKGEEIARANQVNPVNALQGKVAGVNISVGSGGPQSSARVLIRGNNSLNFNNQPLFVVDGVYMESGITGGDSWGDSRDFGNAMKNLNPDDFESISVLKGGAATALYGSKAQNGVVIITTKKGVARKGLGVNVSHSESYDQAYKTLDFQNIYGVGSEPVEFPKDANGDPYTEDNDWGGLSFGPKMSGQRVKNWQGDWITYNPQPNNALDLYQTGKYYNTNVSIEGGGEKGTFRLSYSNNSTSGITPTNKFGRNNFNTRITQKISNFLNVDIGANYVRTDITNPAVNGGNSNLVFASAYSMSRNYDVNYWKSRYIDPQGGVLQNDPYGMSGNFFSQYENKFKQTENNIQGRVGVTANVTPWLDAQVNADLSGNYIDYNSKARGRAIAFTGGDGSFSIAQTNTRQYRIQGVVTARQKLMSDLDATFNLAAETYRDGIGFTTRSYTDGGLQIPDQYRISNSVKQAKGEGSITRGRRTDAVYAFANFAWKDMLFLDVTGRNDWSSSLTYPDGHGNWSYFYPSASLSWAFSDAFKMPSFITFGKLRASYAGTGGDTDPYRTSLGYYKSNGIYLDNQGNSVPLYQYASGTVGNPNLKNEYTRNLEFGADIRFLNNRVGIDVAWYQKNTFNQIINVSTALESGASSYVTNAGNVQNRGIEVLLTTTPVESKDFKWNSTLVFTRNKNTIVAIGPGITTFALPNNLSQGADVQVIAKVGGEYGIMQTSYAFTPYQAVDASGNPIDNPNNGKKVLQANGRYLRSGDAGIGSREIGTIQPKFLSSWTNSFSYKGFSLSAMLDCRVGGWYSSAAYNYAVSGGQLKSTLPGRDAEHGGIKYTGTDGLEHNDGIIPDGVFRNGTIINNVDVSGTTYQSAYDQGLVKPMQAWNYYYRLGSWGNGIREQAMFKNSWVAVREVTVGYSFPQTITSRMKLNSLRMNVVGRNLGYLYTSLPDGLNPEGLYNNSSASAADYGGIPFFRSLGFSVQVGL